MTRRFQFANGRGKFNITLTNKKNVYEPTKRSDPRYGKVQNNPLHVKLKLAIQALRQTPPQQFRLGLLLALHAVEVLGTDARTLTGFHTLKYSYKVALRGIANHENGSLWKKFIHRCPSLLGEDLRHETRSTAS
jgi:hypothetical protein